MFGYSLMCCILVNEFYAALVAIIHPLLRKLVARVVEFRAAIPLI